MKRTPWRCTVCGYVQEGQRPPSHCPICGVQAGMFEERGQDAQESDKPGESADKEKQA